jgi:hypothetical protein
VVELARRIRRLGGPATPVACVGRPGLRERRPALRCRLLTRSQSISPPRPHHLTPCRTKAEFDRVARTLEPARGAKDRLKPSPVTDRLEFHAGFMVEASPAGTPESERSRRSRIRRAGCSWAGCAVGGCCHRSTHSIVVYSTSSMVRSGPARNGLRTATPRTSVPTSSTSPTCTLARICRPSRPAARPTAAAQPQHQRVLVPGSSPTRHHRLDGGLQPPPTPQLARLPGPAVYAAACTHR